MAHYAKVLNGKVIKVIVAEQEFIDLLPQEDGVIWVQTSYNNNFRHRYAGIGYTYNSEEDMFIPPAPYPSWEYSSIIGEWEAPIAQPLDVPLGHYCVWNEETVQWDIVPMPTE